jgi:hypothetical protein
MILDTKSYSAEELYKAVYAELTSVRRTLADFFIALVKEDNERALKTILILLEYTKNSALTENSMEETKELLEKVMK